MVAGERRGRVSTGVALGLAGAVVLADMLRPFVSATRVMNPWVFTASALGVALIALPACYLPARRAAAADPTIALRTE